MHVGHKTSKDTLKLGEDRCKLGEDQSKLDEVILKLVKIHPSYFTMVTIRGC